MRHTQLRQGVQGAVPISAWFVRVHRVGGDEFAGRVHHRHFHTGANAWVQTHDHTWPSRCGQEQVPQVVGKHLDGHFLGRFAQACQQVTFTRQAEFDLPCPVHAFAQQIIGRTALVSPLQMPCDAPNGQGLGLGFAVRWHLGFRYLEFDVEQLQSPSAKHRQGPVRGHFGQRLCVVQVVPELGRLGVVLVFALGQLASQTGFQPQPFAQQMQQSSVFGPTLGQQVAHTIEHSLHRGKIGAFDGIWFEQKGLRF